MGIYKDLIVDIFRAALLSADPFRAVADQADNILLEYQKGNYERLYLIGFGKGLSPMVRANGTYGANDIRRGCYHEIWICG